MSFRGSIAAVACVAAALGPGAAAAVAQSPVQSAYGEDGGVLTSMRGGSPPAQTTVAASPAPQTPSGSGLPFSGFEVGVLVAMALTLTGTGLVLRRANPRRDRL